MFLSKEEVLLRTGKINSVVCIASGPSLTDIDVNYVQDKNCHVFVINDNWIKAPWADVLYSCDQSWWRCNFKFLDGHFDGIKFSLDETYMKDVVAMKKGAEDGINYEWPILNTGHNSGYQAVNLAIHLGAKNIFLLGYDMKLGSKNEIHWFGKHTQRGLGNPSSQSLKTMAHFFNTMKKYLKDGVEIINCTENSAISVFQKKKIQDCL